jgi:uncharacterized repeat protein (TIGR03803 family)
MPSKKTLTLLIAILVVAIGFLTTAAPAFAANTEHVLYSFTDGVDGGYPAAPLVFDSNGNLYGTTSNGGANGYGTVFELSPTNGAWTETVLHSFNYNGIDGFGPSGLVFDSFGNLYGTTFWGGSGTACSQGCGTVFELSPAAGGSWTETILYDFRGHSDGYYPDAGVILDAQGNVYGTTLEGGAVDHGTVFELASGTWTKTLLHSFKALTTKDGAAPEGALIFDGDGNLYGTTYGGGAGGVCPHGGGCGTVYELASNGKGGWTESVVHSFSYKGISRPSCTLIFDSAGNLYGTTGESWDGYGAVFELSPSAKGVWKETTLHKFTTFKSGGARGALVFDSKGNLYGAGGGGEGCAGEGCGVVVKLVPSKTKWTETTLFSFNDKDGAIPIGSLIFDASGNLYGTTEEGGSGSCDDDGITGCGTVFEIMP